MKSSTYTPRFFVHLSGAREKEWHQTKLKTTWEIKFCHQAREKDEENSEKAAEWKRGKRKNLSAQLRYIPYETLYALQLHYKRTSECKGEISCATNNLRLAKFNERKYVLRSFFLVVLYFRPKREKEHKNSMPSKHENMMSRELLFISCV